MTEATRAYLYRIALALLAACVAFKVLAPDVIEPVVNVVAAVLGIGSAGLAAKNTSTASKGNDAGTVTLQDIVLVLVGVAVVVWLVITLR